MSQPQASQAVGQPLSHAFGMACGIVAGVLYTMPLHGLTIDYFIDHVRPLLHTTFSYQSLWYVWLIILGIAVVTFVRCAVVWVITLIRSLMTSVFVRLSVPRKPWG